MASNSTIAIQQSHIAELTLAFMKSSSELAESNAKSSELQRELELQKSKVIDKTILWTQKLASLQAELEIKSKDLYQAVSQTSDLEISLREKSQSYDKAKSKLSDLEMKLEVKSLDLDGALARIAEMDHSLKGTLNVSKFMFAFKRY